MMVGCIVHSTAFEDKGEWQAGHCAQQLQLQLSLSV